MSVVLWNRNLSDCRTCEKAVVLSDDRHAWANQSFQFRKQNPRHDTKIHLDSARFWETFAASACSLSGSGASFDSMTFCYQKTPSSNGDQDRLDWSRERGDRSVAMKRFGEINGSGINKR